MLDTNVPILYCAFSHLMPRTIQRYNSDRQADRGYSIRDAATVSDEDVKNGKKPKQIAYFLFEDEAINYIKQLTA